MDELVSHSGINFADFQTVFPLYVIDTSNHKESLKGQEGPSMRVEVMLKRDVPANTSVYAVLISDKRVLMEVGSMFQKISFKQNF